MHLCQERRCSATFRLHSKGNLFLKFMLFRRVEIGSIMSRVNLAIILISIVIVSRSLSAEIISEVSKAFQKYDVVPDAIQIPPKNFLKVTYDGLTNVYLGNELTPKQVKFEPIVKWRTAVGSYYTLVMIDPDMPSRIEPTMRAMNHWMVGNIPENKVQKGEGLVAYVGSEPALNTGLHRYVFLLYRQPGKLCFREPYIENNNIEGRMNFNITDFALKYGLGEPISGNFYLSQ